MPARSDAAGRAVKPCCRDDCEFEIGSAQRRPVERRRWGDMRERFSFALHTRPRSQTRRADRNVCPPGQDPYARAQPVRKPL